MSGITEFSLNNSRITILALVAVIATGIFAFLDYPQIPRPAPGFAIRSSV